VFFDELFEVVDLVPGFVEGGLRVAGGEEFILAHAVDGLLVVLHDLQQQVAEVRIVEWCEGFLDEGLFSGGELRLGWRRSRRRPGHRPRFSLDCRIIEGIDQIMYQVIDRLSPGMAADFRLLLVGHVGGEARELAGQGAGGIRIGAAGFNVIEAPAERLGGLAVDRATLRFALLADSDRIDGDETRFGAGVGGDAFEGFGRHDADAAALHLLKIVGALDRPHEEERFRRASRRYRWRSCPR
jgi:hypothetical protein